MRIRATLITLLAFVGLFCAAAVQAALEKGQIFFGANGQRYVLEETIGAGSFGQVWRARELTSGKRIALKFFFDAETAKDLTANVARLLERMPEGENVLRFQPPQTLTEFRSGEQFTVVPSELAGGTVEALAEKNTRLRSGLTPSEVRYRVNGLYALTVEGIGGLRHFHESGFVHHDPNPRNILDVEGVNKLGDPDGATEIGKLPPVGAAELKFGGIEYENPEHLRKSGPLVDYFTFGNTVMFAMSGKSPLTVYAEKFHRGDISAARRRLFEDEEARADFEELVRAEIRRARILAGADAATSAKMDYLAKFFEAALTVDPARRKTRLAAFNPSLGPAFQATRPNALPEIDPDHLYRRPSSNVETKEVPAAKENPQSVERAAVAKCDAAFLYVVLPGSAVAVAGGAAYLIHQSGK